MIDLDRLKALNLNADTYSCELLALHRWQAAVDLHFDLLVSYMREHPNATSAELADADFAASVVADDRVQRMEAA